MIIGIDASRALTRQRTGTEAYAYYLIHALIEQCRQTPHTLRLYFHQPPLPHLLANDEQVEHVVIPFPRLWTHSRLAFELYRRPPDVFFTPSHVIPFTYWGHSVATVHDVGYEYFPDAHTRKQLTYLRWSTRHNVQRGKRVVAVSETTKEGILQFYGGNAGKIDVIHSGIDPSLAPITDENILGKTVAHYGITPPYFLYMSTIQPRKNVARLVEAYAQLPTPRPQLIIAGKVGWRAQSILDGIRNLPADISAQVKVVGFIEDGHKAALLSGAKALLYPSLYEGFGFPVLEAQVCGTPVLCSDSSSLPEIAGAGALLVQANSVDSIKQGIEILWRDEEKCRQLVARGFENVARFSWQQTAQQVWHTLIQATL